MLKFSKQANTATMRIVLVTMDSHLAGAAERANEWLGQHLPGAEFTVHAASDWGSNATKFAQCEAAIAQANIIIASMLFMEDHFKPLLPLLAARRDDCDAMVCIMSATEVMKLTKLGGFDMSATPGGLMGMLKKLRPKSVGKKDADGQEIKSGAPRGDDGRKQMKMLQALPKLLRFIPGTAQDVRAFFMCMQYWLAGSQANVANMVHFLVHRYAAGDRKALRGLGKPQAPVEYPEVGIYHPRLRAGKSPRPAGLATELSAMPLVATTGKVGTVGLLVLRSYLLAGNTGHYDGVITALEARGLRVIPAFASGLDAREAINQYFYTDGAVAIDAMISLTGFSLIGGPAYNDQKAAEETLTKLDVPYIAVCPVEFQTIEQWQDSERGLLPVESTMMIALPELDGATGSMVYGGRSETASLAEGQSRHDMVSHTERADAVAARVEKLVKLRKSNRADRKIAVVLFNFPPNAGHTGTAAFLAVFESLFNTLRNMQAGGYSIDMPASVDDLRSRIINGNAQQLGAMCNVHTKISADDHVKRERHLKEIEAQWGPAPGRQQSDGTSIFVLGAQFGNVFVGIQPSFGYEGDPMRLLFGKGLAPTHAFSAFYRFIREDFAADAILHFGTHGALEFMPGKQSGLSGECWPERLIGDAPNLYLYACNNPSEGAIAKRRSGATLISYLTPASTEAGLYKGLIDLKASCDRFRCLEDECKDERVGLLGLIQTQAVSLDLLKADAPWPVAADAAPELVSDEAVLLGAQLVLQLQGQILELEYSLIPHGLHIVGAQLSSQERADMLMSVAESTHGQDRTDVLRIICKAVADGCNAQDASRQFNPSEPQAALSWLTALVDINHILGHDYETEGLMRAMDARFIRPAPGGDLIRNPAVLPTGRNLHGFDPFRIPSAYAVNDGARQTMRLLARHAADGNPFPESIAIVLWGTDNLKSEGAPIGQALALVGAKPRFDSYGRLVGATLIPLEELGRPRIDIVVTLSGIFRDLLPLQIKLLAEATWLAASVDEPIEQNFVRKHALAYMAEHGGDLETASLRVFGNAEGAYGANINLLVDSSQWNQNDELAETYTQRKGFAYGRSGVPRQQMQLLNSVLADVSFAYQNLESVELGVTTVDTYFDTLGGISRAVQRAKKKEAKQGEVVGELPIYISDQTTGKEGSGHVRSLSEQVAIETRTRTLNPKWYEGMLAHGFEGVRQIEQNLTNTIGWSATTGQVQPWVYQQITQTFMLDPEMRNRLAQLNPTAAAKVASRLIEAADRKFWTPTPEMLAELKQADEELEDRLEGVFEPKQQGVTV